MGLRIPNGRKLPPTINTFLFNEDVDLSGGAGAVAAALLGGEIGHELNGTDQILCPSPLTLMGLQYADEQSTVADADGYLAIGNKRRIELPLEITDFHNCQQAWFPSPIKLASREGIDLVGRSTGGGAEQHSCILFVDQPDLGEPWAVRAPGGGDITQIVALVSSALVAQTQSGFADICGRTTAFVGGQRSIPNRPDIGVNLLAATLFAGAGYSGCTFRHPKSNRQLALMANGGLATAGIAAAVGPTAQRYDFVEMFGGGLFCSADKPITMGGFGVGTTAVQALLELELVGVGVEG